ncbi:hypothetical protein QBK99_10990 [Corticibacterium sp. UT-5YL-CI-8]|nr:hypothetical protein [Tianweitania sp. UT-5YL-CI-8]
MTIKLSSLKADLAREAKGDWIEFPDWPGVEFNVSSLLLPAYTTARDLLMQRLTRQSKGKPIARDLMTSEIGKLYAKHILHGWRGLDVEYSPDAAAETLADPEYRAVVAAVEWCASKVSDIDIQFVEDAGKNSDKPSATA